MSLLSPEVKGWVDSTMRFTSHLAPLLAMLMAACLRAWSVTSFHILHCAETRPYRALDGTPMFAPSSFGFRRRYCDESFAVRSYTRLLLEDESSASSSSEMKYLSVDEAVVKELTDETIAEMIEVSFVQSCLQLSQGYIDVLKLFIAAVKAGYEHSVSLTALHALVKECNVKSANRNLTSDEEKLRYEWMKMVYEILNALQYKRGIVQPSVTLVEFEVGKRGGEAGYRRISAVVQAMLSIRDQLIHEEASSGGENDATLAMMNLTVEVVLQRSPSLAAMMDELLVLDPVGRAFLTNDVRVALVTFRVLEEERICLQDSAGSATISGKSGSGGGTGEGEAPRPPIPGT